MDVTPTLTAGRQLIQSYGGGHFMVNEQRHDHSVFVTPASTERWDCTNDVLTVTDLAPWLDNHPGIDILLIGTGQTQQFLSPSIKRDIKSIYGAVIDVMDTGAACRTFNVLMAEDRRVAAALRVI